MNEWAAAAPPLHGRWAEPRRRLPLIAAFRVRLAPFGAPQPCSTSSSSSSSCCSSSTSSSSSTTTTPRRSREAGKRRYARPGIAGLSRGSRSFPPPAEARLRACPPPAGKATKGSGGRRAGAGGVGRRSGALGAMRGGGPLWGGRAAGCWQCEPALRRWNGTGQSEGMKGCCRQPPLGSAPSFPARGGVRGWRGPWIMENALFFSEIHPWLSRVKQGLRCCIFLF